MIRHIKEEKIFYMDEGVNGSSIAEVKFYKRINGRWQKEYISFRGLLNDSFSDEVRKEVDRLEKELNERIGE